MKNNVTNYNVSSIDPKSKGKKSNSKGKKKKNNYKRNPK